MLVIPGKNSSGNVLHVAIGEESEFWMDLHGSSVVDITPVLNTMEVTKKVYLHLTRCGSEHQLADQLAAASSAGNNYPFPSGTHVFVPKRHKVFTPDDTANAAVSSATQPVMCECSRCGRKDVEMVPRVEPAICYDCLHLDLALASVRRNAAEEEAYQHASQVTDKDVKDEPTK